MADVKMPESIPCRFDVAWMGRCNKPSTNGMCGKHEKLKCASCGKAAVRTCENEYCGANLCGDCKHPPTLPGERPRHDHVSAAESKRLWKEYSRLDKEERESDAAIQARGVSLGLPRHLKELLSSDRAGYELKPAYSLSIKHGLMGYFPAIVEDTKAIVLTTDKELVFRVWMSLEPRDSVVERHEYMLNEKLNVAYAMCTSEFDQRYSRPLKVFSAEEINALFEKDEHPFRWAPGLIGARASKEEFERLIERAALEHKVMLPV